MIETNLATADRLVVGAEPVKVRLESELFITVTAMGYTAAVHVYLLKRKRKAYLLAGSKSICQGLEQVRLDSNGLLNGACVWISKKSEEKTAPYVIELAYE